MKKKAQGIKSKILPVSPFQEKKAQGIKSKILPVSPFQEKKAQMQLSFGMIFAIILIIIFISFAIYGIGKFLKMQKEIQIRSFVKEIKDDVDTVWKSPETSQKFSYTLPKKIIQVCFEDKGKDRDNMRLILKEGFGQSEKIEHLDISSKTCMDNKDGKVEIRLSKDFGESLVRVGK